MIELTAGNIIIYKKLLVFYAIKNLKSTIKHYETHLDDCFDSDCLSGQMNLMIEYLQTAQALFEECEKPVYKYNAILKDLK